MTWNLWWQFGPWEERQVGIHQVVREVGPDILCVQESWAEQGPAGQIVSQVAGLGDTLGFAHHAPVELSFRRRPESPAAKMFTNAIISRWPLSDIKVIRLPRADGTPSYRTAVLCTADTPEGPVRVVTAHLSHIGQDDLDRLAQAQRLGDLISSDLSTILAGDLNMVPDSAELSALADAGLIDAWDPKNGDGWTWAETNTHAQGARYPNRRLDYILSGPDLKSKASGLAGTEPVNGVLPSDHYAVWADF